LQSNTEGASAPPLRDWWIYFPYVSIEVREASRIGEKLFHAVMFDGETTMYNQAYNDVHLQVLVF